LPIDLDPALRDQLFALPAASQAGRREDFLQALAMSLGVILPGRRLPPPRPFALRLPRRPPASVAGTFCAGLRISMRASGHR